MNKIGVNIDLSVFFEDERKLVLVMVDPKWESVECLQKRVQFLFGVDLVRFLNSDGYFLPPQEPIEIIKFCKGLKAFVPAESLEKRKKKKSKKAKAEEISSLDSEGEETSNSVLNNEEQKDLSQKRKYHSLQSGVTTGTNPQSAKRLKNCLIVDTNTVSQINKSSEISSTSEQMPPPPLVYCEKSDVKKSQSSSVVSDEMNEQRSRKNTLSRNGNDLSKRRHTSSPHEKDISEIVDNVKRTFDEEMKARPSSLHSSTMIMDPATPNKTNEFKKGKSLEKNRGHTYFNESGKMVSTFIEASKSPPLTEKDTKKPQTITIFRCPLNDVVNQKPRVFQINSSTTSPNKPVLEIQEEIIIRANTLEKSLNESLEQSDSQQTTATLQNNTKDSLPSINQDKSDVTEATTTLSTSTPNSEQKANDLTSAKNLETSATAKDQSNPDDSLNYTNLKNDLNETSVLSIDSLDQSIVIDDEDDESKNKQDKKQQQSHDLTKDDRDDDSSDVEEISDIIDLNETDDNCDSTVNTSEKRFRQSSIVVHKVLPFCQDMLDLPNIGDIIVFKVPYINKKSKASETNFIAGIAEYINKRTRTIKILIKDGLVELPHVPNKFFCHLNESEEQFKYLQLKLNDMLEPKFCSRS